MTEQGIIVDESIAVRTQNENADNLKHLAKVAGRDAANFLGESATASDIIDRIHQQFGDAYIQEATAAANVYRDSKGWKHLTFIIH